METIGYQPGGANNIADEMWEELLSGHSNHKYT